MWYNINWEGRTRFAGGNLASSAGHGVIAVKRSRYKEMSDAVANVMDIGVIFGFIVDVAKVVLAAKTLASVTVALAKAIKKQ